MCGTRSAEGNVRVTVDVVADRLEHCSEGLDAIGNDLLDDRGPVLLRGYITALGAGTHVSKSTTRRSGKGPS
jgi:hypothetical protein